MRIETPVIYQVIALTPRLLWEHVKTDLVAFNRTSMELKQLSSTVLALSPASMSIRSYIG